MSFFDDGIWRRICYEALQRDAQGQTFYWAYKVMSVMRLQDKLLEWLRLPSVLVNEVYAFWNPFHYEEEKVEPSHSNGVTTLPLPTLRPRRQRPIYAMKLKRSDTKSKPIKWRNKKR